MNRTRNIRGAALAAVLLVGAVALATQQGVVLKRELVKGSTDNYKIELSMDSTFESPMGPMDMTLKGGGDYALSIKEVKEDKADVEIKLTDLNMEMGGAVADMAQGQMGDLPKEMTLNGQMDSRNRLTGMKMATQSRSAQMMAMSGMSSSNFASFIEFPDKPVNVGDAWDMKVPANPMVGSKEATLKATLVGEDVWQDLPVWRVKAAGKVPVDGNMGDAASATTGMQIDGTMKGSMDMDLEALVDKANGRTVKLTGTTKSDVNLNISGMDLATKGTIRVLLTYKK